MSGFMEEKPRKTWGKVVKANLRALDFTEELTRLGMIGAVAFSRRLTDLSKTDF